MTIKNFAFAASLALTSSLLADGLPFSMKENFEPFDGVIVYEKVNIRFCPSLDCKVVEIGKEGDLHEVVGVTSDGRWYQLDDKENYVRDYLIEKASDVATTKDAIKEIVSNKLLENMPIKKKEVAKIKTTEPHESDSLYIHSPELAEKYRDNALIANLTQASSPKPIMKAPRYARILIFPVLNEKGDVYYDYNYAWVKIKDESFVLGQREGKETQDSFFSIHKKVK